MPHWHRLIVIFLLATFAPSSVLAAMPVVWCMGHDGHRAVEYKASVSHVAHCPLGSKHDEVAQVNDEGDGCRDSQLIDKAKAANGPSDGVLPFGLRNVIELRMSAEPVAPTSKLSPPACTG